jgi:hypothetical protein
VLYSDDNDDDDYAHSSVRKDPLEPQVFTVFGFYLLMSLGAPRGPDYKTLRITAASIIALRVLSTYCPMTGSCGTNPVAAAGYSLMKLNDTVTVQTYIYILNGRYVEWKHL